MRNRNWGRLYAKISRAVFFPPIANRFSLRDASKTATRFKAGRTISLPSNGFLYRLSEVNDEKASGSPAFEKRESSLPEKSKGFEFKETSGVDGYKWKEFTNRLHHVDYFLWEFAMNEWTNPKLQMFLELLNPTLNRHKAMLPTRSNDTHKTNDVSERGYIKLEEYHKLRQTDNT